MNKSEQRCLGLKARRMLGSEDRVRADSKIAKILLDRPEVIQAKTVCTYISTPYEVDTRRIIQQLLILKKIIVVPEISGDILKLPELSSVDVFIVPIVAVDRKGNRLGWGKGYYDKLLSNVITVPRIGLSYSVQVVAEVSHTSYDVPMTTVITEREVYENKTS